MNADVVRSGETRLGLQEERWAEKTPFRVVLASFVCIYSLVQFAIAVALADANPLLAPALVLLVLLAAGVFVGGLLDDRRMAHQFYLALCVLPCLTLARLAFTSGVSSAFDPLFVYLLLAVALLVYRQSTGARPVVLEGWAAHPIGTLLGGFLLAAPFVLLGFRISSVGPLAFGNPPLLDLAVVAPIALLDEVWFRGILQGQLAAATSRPSAFFATFILFVAYGAPFGGVPILAFRATFGFVFGLVALRRRSLPVALTARVLLAWALVVLTPAALGTSLLV